MPKTRYRLGSKSGKRPTLALGLTALAVLLLLAGAYLLVLTQAPALPFGPTPKLPANTPQVAGVPDNSIEIASLNNLQVPFFAGTNASVLDKGAWWRHPERGDPEKGGNFILSAHRFQLALTPWSTRDSSPFYHLDKVKVGDTIKVAFNHKWYWYQVNRLYDVPADAIQIEATSTEAKMTLYSCSLKGAADGRQVVEAKPIKAQEQ